MRFTTTKKAAKKSGVKVLVYGKSGVGKTRLCATAPKPVILSLENRLLSLRSKNIPVVEIDAENVYEELLEILSEINAGKFKSFQTICMDSVSEFAEQILAAEKGNVKDNRQAYGLLADKATDVLKKFRDLRGYNVYFIAKQGHLADDEGDITYHPYMPGGNLTVNLPYWIDEVFYYKMEKGVKKKANRILYTRDGYNFEAKDSSGALEVKERPNLKAIFEKIALHKTKKIKKKISK